MRTSTCRSKPTHKLLSGRRTGLHPVIAGAGRFFVDSIQNRDGFLLGGVVVVYCALLVFFNLLVDLAYARLDRRIRLYD